MEFFSASKEQVEQLTGDLDEMRQQLQAAHKDLQETRLKLSEETFISSKLKTTEGELYSTADKVSKQTLLVLCDYFRSPTFLPQWQGKTQASVIEMWVPEATD